MRVAGESMANHLRTTPAALLRAGCVVLWVCVSGCGGGSAPQGSMPAPDSNAPVDTTEPPPAPAQLVLGTTLSIDDGASGNPVDLRVVRATNGDGFALWLADDGTRRNLWANRYRAAASMWGTPINIEARDADIDRFDLTVDASGNATVVWFEPQPAPSASFTVMSARFEVGAGAWTTPVLLGGFEGYNLTPHATSDATGAVLATDQVVHFFDPATGAWRPEREQIPIGIISSGDINTPQGLLDGSGNAVIVFHYANIAFDSLATNYYSRSTGSWDPFPPGFEDGVFRPVPNSFVFGWIENVQLANTPGGNFLMAWQPMEDVSVAVNASIRVARHISSTRTWTPAQTLVPTNAQNDVRFQRIGTDASGNALLLWTQTDGNRTALKAFRLAHDDFSCGPVHIVDLALGGGAARADLGVDPQGNAIAIWQQFEGGRPDDGSRSNIAIARFDRAAGAWAPAVLAETEPGNAISPRASANGGKALLGWIQSEGGVNRVKALLQSLDGASS
jgi:hypothetical protein